MEKVRLDTITTIDCLEGLRLLEDNTVQCCVTSPPYWRLRDYNVAGQVGMENNLNEYVERLVNIFEEVRRVLTMEGVLWLNLGDCYWGSGKSGKRPGRNKTPPPPSKNQYKYGPSATGKHPELKPKDLIGVPWMIAFALRNKGWYLRQEIIWHKKNAMPESVKDRCTRTHETIFMFSKSPAYYYNAQAIKTPLASSTLKDKRLQHEGAYNRVKNYCKNALNTSSVSESKSTGSLPIPGRSDKQNRMGIRHRRFNERWAKRDAASILAAGANRRSVWALPYRPFKGNHFATFPQDLPELCIRAGSQPGDTILDPFMGSGTTALAAKALQRHYIGFELNPEYTAIAEQRIVKQK